METVSLDQLSHYLPRIGRAINVLLVLVLILIVAQLAWKGIQWIRAPELELPTAPPSTVVERPAPNIDYGQQVARLHLFGTVTASVPVVRRAVSESRLPLFLKGVFAGDTETGKDGYAIIQEQGKAQKLYKVGDEISAGVSLDAVYQEYVLVERAGALEKVSLPRTILSSVPLSPTIRTPTPTSEEGASSGAQPLSRVREEILRSPTKLTQLISIVPYRQNDTFIGFQVMPAEDPQLFHQLGLEEGDIVTSINGIKLDGPGKSIEAIDELMDAKDINLTILRDDATVSLVQSFNE